MTRVIYATSTTFNGFLADDADSLDWLFAVPGADAATDDFAGFLAGIGVLVQGSTTYEWVLAHEDLLAHPEKWQDFYGERPTWVFTTRTLSPVPGADIRFASGSVADVWPAIARAAAGRDVWVAGGGDLAGQFADAGLLDELILTIAPATLSSGRPLLPRTLGSDRLRLMSVVQKGQFAELTYQVGAVEPAADSPSSRE